MVTGAMVARAASGLGLLWLVIALPVLQRGAGFAFDLACYFDAAARLAVGGNIYLPFTIAAPFVHGGPGTYVYAPPLAVALLPLTVLPFDSAAVVWYLARIAMLALACGLLPVTRTIRFGAFAVTALSGAFLSDQSLGNVNALLLLGVACAWRWFDRPAAAIAMALSASLRPQLAVVVGWWALRRRWRLVAVTALSLVVLAALTLPFVGLQAYLDFISLLRNIRFEGAPNNVSLDAAARLLGLPAVVGTGAFLAGAVLAVGAVVAARNRGQELGFVVGIAASLLVTPLLWPHYLVLVVVPAAYLAARGRVWGLALPLLTWLPPPLLPLVALVALLAPFTAPASGAGGSLEPDPVAGLRP
jgi:hypothetical protein